jgi:predicted nucleic acid-binding protein
LPIPKGSRVYIDTMVWVYHLAHQSHAEYVHCKALLDQVRRKEITAVSSTFVLTEIQSATRMVLSEKRRGPLTEAEVKQIREAAVREMETLGVDLQDADQIAASGGGLTPLFARAANLIETCGGHFVSRHRTPKWKGLGGADAIHLSLAERLNSDYLATCDSDFKDATSPVRASVLRETYL